MQAVVAGIGDNFVEVLRNCADVFINAPFVVIEDTNKLAGSLGNVIEGLKGNSVGERGITEDAHDILVSFLLVARRAHSECCGEGRAGVPRAEAVVLALGA